MSEYCVNCEAMGRRAEQAERAADVELMKEAARLLTLNECHEMEQVEHAEKLEAALKAKGEL